MAAPKTLMGSRCLIVKAGLVDYHDGLNLQDKARYIVQQGCWDGILLLLEHLPVITVGARGNRDNILRNNSELQHMGIAVVNTSRGGDVTCHSPGQLVGYPVMNLGNWQRDVHSYVNLLEELLIRVLARYGLRAGRKASYTGVWLNDEKVAAIGVAVRRWITYHGFALNINNNLELFNQIVPCGIHEFGVTSLAKNGVNTEFGQIINTLINEFSIVFGCSMHISDKLIEGDYY
ncbi:lipoyl(octanoyl) transferase LipB [Dendrosporobacter sp. 1207_IL3150]|uniref:lipoyl(octanoyl) transferase LipB n=1 Tax=Dendrosporobacter sp. 1207_IL3150 TaxID=3084054 RepID=UPI002FDB4FF9